MSSDSDSDSDPGRSSKSDSSDTDDSPPPEKRRRTTQSKDRWDQQQLSNLRKNYRFLEHFDDSIVSSLSFRDIITLAGKKEKGSKVLSEKLASNFETVEGFRSRSGWRPVRTIAPARSTTPGS